jgi:peroxin-13
MDPNNLSLVQQVGSSTSQTFALIQSIVQTFGGFAQMLDSTFMATQSSFFAMLGVAEQFAHLKGALSQVLGVFGLVAWLRSWWRGEKKRSMREEFQRFLQNTQSAPGANGGSPPSPSKKPLIVFLLAVFGLPYLMHRLIRHLAARLPQQQPGLFPGQLPSGGATPIDPSKLSFARAAYAFPTSDPVELSLAKDEIVAVLSTQDPITGAEGEWWRGRTRDGREGWFPKAYVDVIKPKEALGTPQPPVSETLKVVS